MPVIPCWVADGRNVGAVHVVSPVEEEHREVLAVGEAQHRVQRLGRHRRVGHGRLRESQRAAGLHKASLVDGDFLEGDFRSVRRICEGTCLAISRPGSSGSFAISGTPRRSSAGRAAFPEGHAALGGNPEKQKPGTPEGAKLPRRGALGRHAAHEPEEHGHREPVAASWGEAERDDTKSRRHWKRPRTCLLESPADTPCLDGPFVHEWTQLALPFALVGRGRTGRSLLAGTGTRRTPSRSPSHRIAERCPGPGSVGWAARGSLRPSTDSVASSRPG
jgi:hypothetical protein